MAAAAAAAAAACACIAASSAATTAAVTGNNDDLDYSYPDASGLPPLNDAGNCSACGLPRGTQGSTTRRWWPPWKRND